MHHVSPPTEQQTLRINAAKAAADAYARAIDAVLPDGSYKTNIMHKLRAVALIINEFITHTE